MRGRVYALLIAMLLMTIGNVWANRYYVDISAGNDSNGGTSWGDAFANLQAALDKVVAGDEIWIAKGIYKPTKILGGGLDDRDKAFLLAVDVKFYGGFAGDESSIDERVSGNTTVLSGDIDAISGLSADDAFHVLLTRGLSNAAIIDGITISGGNADGSGIISAGGGSFNRTYGGGMYNVFSSPVITNVIISENETADIGGGMFNDNSSPIIKDVMVSNNKATYAGGIENAFSSSPVLTNVIISGNVARNNGGGVYSTASSSPILTNVIITGNTAGGLGGGMLNDNNSNPTLTNVTISGNVAASGGAIFNTISFPELYNCLVLGNSSGVNDDNSLSTYGNCFVQELDIPTTGIMGTAPNADDVFIDYQPATAGVATTAGNYRLKTTCDNDILRGGSTGYWTELNYGGGSTQSLLDLLGYAGLSDAKDLDGKARVNDVNEVSIISLGAYQNVLSITYDLQDGSPVTTQTVEENTLITAPSDPTRAGYTFAGWYNAPTGGTKITYPFLIVSSVTIYAHWVEIRHTTITRQPQGIVICNHTDSYTLSVTATGDDLSYQWYRDGQPILNAVDSRYVITGLTEGFSASYHVKVSGFNGTVDSESVLVHVAVPLPSTPEFITIPSGILNADGTYTFTVKEYPDVLQYLWSSKNSTAMFSASEGRNVKVSFTKAGTETINVRLMHKCGGFVARSFTFTIANSTGLAQIGDATFRAYPNPTGGMLTVSGLTPGSTMRLYNPLGTLVDTYAAEAEDVHLNLSSLASGTYLLNVDGQTVRVIKH